jgi:curved DNA-binding protein CbpA
MFEDAFKILGLEPTTSSRAIRDAYVRLVRIYHPDRFVGMPDDVRAEAERRMKELSAAYEGLRSAKRKAAKSPPPTPAASRRKKKDPWEEVKRVRAEAAQRRREQEESRHRWLLWEELERQARERAAYEASLATLAEDAQIRIPEATEPAREPEPESMLVRRLKVARGAQGDELVPRKTG